MARWRFLSFALLIGLSCTSASAKELRAAAFINTGNTWSEPFEQWINQVNAHGLVNIRLIGAEVISAAEQPTALKEGQLDIIASPPGNYRAYMPEAPTQNLSNLTLNEQRASGGYNALNQLLSKRLNAISLTSYGTGVPFHLYLTTPIQSVSELKNKRIRAQVLQTLFLNALGAHVVTADLTNLSPALDYNLIDGFAYTLWGVDDFSWHERIAQRIDPGFYSASVNILINKTIWHELEEREQQSLLKASQWLEDTMQHQYQERNQHALKLQQRAGISAFDAGSEFANQAHELYWQALEDKSPIEVPKLRRLLVEE